MMSMIDGSVQTMLINESRRLNTCKCALCIIAQTLARFRCFEISPDIINWGVGGFTSAGIAGGT